MRRRRLNGECAMVRNIDDLNSIHIDVLREIGNIGAGNAKALAKLLNRKIDMDVPRVKVMDFRMSVRPAERNCLW